ncbi:MAG TPA: hypothetical protein VE985_05720 [Gaiellaceae bacterium]|nr:hypothetical protein [Gaiellaceae bacterium]
MSGLRLLGLLLATVLLFVPTRAGAAQSQRSEVKVTAHGVVTLAMDGPRVAYASAGRIYVWNVATGSTSAVKGEYSNATHSINASQVAIAGTRVAWIKRVAYGNTEESEKLYTAPLGGPAQVIAHGYIFGREDSAHAVGGWIAGAVGSGKVLAVSTWKSNDAATSHEKLSLITHKGLRPIVTGPGAIVAEAANGGHVAVLRSLAAWPADEPSTPTTEPTVGIYSSDGKLLREISLTTPIPPPPSSDGYYASTLQNSVALSGNRLIVLTETSPETGPAPWTWTTTLQVFDWTTGSLLQTWPLSFKPFAINAAAPLAAYGQYAAVEGRQLHLVDLASGKNTVVSGGAGSDAALGPRGLVYATSGGKGHGKLVFQPLSKLPSLVG